MIVAHDGSRWLPEALAALAAQTVRPARVIAVDTGSSDGSANLLRRATGHVLELSPTTGYGSAVAAALAALPADTGWVWLLHDDCAPDASALEALLTQARRQPDAAVLGPKVVDWDDPRVLVEAGVTTDGTGYRDTGVEPGELDQGQLHAPRGVLAVGTAGALVRRDVWDQLGGLDPALPLFRNEVDLGWRANAAGHAVVVVPAARMRHVRAVTTGRRRPHAVRGRLLAVDRRAALHVQLAHAAGWRVAAALPWLVLVGLLRALSLLLSRQPGAASDELTALAGVLGRPARLLGARRARAATRELAPGALRPLMASPAARTRLRVGALLDRGGPRGVPTLDEPRPAPRLPVRPGLVLTLTLAVLALLAGRDLLGGGVLAGGRLLPVPATAGQLWSGYATSGEPALAVLAALATALLGKAALLTDLLLLGAVPLAGAVAYGVAGRVVGSRGLRTWAAASWALLPVATGAVAGGRLDTVAVHIALPALLLLGHRVATEDPRRAGWSHAWALGLALAVVAALAPLLWPLGALLLVGAGVQRILACAAERRPAARRRALACALAAAVPAIVLPAWSSGFPLLHGPGRLGPGLADGALPAWQLLLLQPGGPGTPVVLATAGLLLAALGGLLRSRRAGTAAAGWGLALTGLAAALLLTRTSAAGSPVWPGLPLDLAAAGMLLAALVGAEGLQERLSRSSFGWRQLTSVLVVVLAGAVPVVCAVEWLRSGADSPLQRVDPFVLPAFVRAELAAEPGLRALLLTERPDGTVGYALTGAAGPQWGDRPAALDPPVAELLTPRGTDAAGTVAAAGVRFVALTGADGPAAAALDAQPGLDRQPVFGPALWRVLPAASPVAEPPGVAPALLALQALAVVLVAVQAGPRPPGRRGLEVQR
ncbi:MAG: glycosyltransferase [Mycobacteriales bacterium]